VESWGLGVLGKKGTAISAYSSRWGLAGLGMARRGKVRLGMAGLGTAGRGGDRRGRVWQGEGSTVK
jgi:hypothetical protein